MEEGYNASRWLVDRHVENGNGDRLAIICGDDRLTYADVLDQVFRVHNALADLAVRRDERVAMVLNDQPAFHAWFLGCLRAGAVAVPISTMLTADELGSVINDAGSRVVVVSAAYAGFLEVIKRHAPALEIAVVVDSADKRVPGLEVRAWDSFEDRTPTPVASTIGDSPGFWLYSSGTTGLPKGVMHRHANLEATAATFARTVLGTSPSDRFLSVAKLFFAYGLGNSLTFPFAVGATAVLNPDRPTPQSVADVVRANGVTMLFMPPGFAAAMLDLGISRDALASVHTGSTAGEALPAELHRRFTEHFGFPVLDGIGTTEALHIFISNHRGRERPGTSGTPVAGYEVKLLDESDREVTEADQPGFLHVRGESIATGYYARTDATRANFRGEWLRTGDVYTRSADGYLSFLGRNTDMMKVGGIWVSPAEVEGVLVEHPDVLEAAVVGSRTTDGLETAIAFIVARSGHTIEESSIYSHCRERMAAYKRPRQVIVVDELPKTATGKIRRVALREHAGDAGAHVSQGS